MITGNDCLAIASDLITTVRAIRGIQLHGGHPEIEKCFNIVQELAAPHLLTVDNEVGIDMEPFFRDVLDRAQQILEGTRIE